MGFGIAPQIEAAEWSILPSIGTKGVYNDNLLLTPFPHNATYGYWISPATEFASKTERLEFTGRIAADFATYYGGQTSQFTNIFLPLSISYKDEKDTLGFKGGLTRDNTLMSELFTTGLVLRFTQRNEWTATPSWTRSLTEKLSFQTSFQFSNITYEDGQRLGLVDYSVLGGTSGLLYQLTEKDQVQLSGSYTDFHTTNATSQFRANFPGANVNLSHAFTESFTGTIYGGPRFVTSNTQSLANAITLRSTVWLFGASLSKQFENTSVQISVARDVIPTGLGLLIQTDRASLMVNHDFTETLSASFDTSGFLTSGITKLPVGGTLPESRYFALSPKITCKLFEWWRLDLSYTYGWRDVPGLLDPAMSNSTTFMLTYYPPKLALSR